MATQEDVDRANAAMPVGTLVRYYSGPRWMGCRACEIRAPFGLSLDGRLVGWVTGQAGYVCADHIEPGGWTTEEEATVRFCGVAK